MLNSFLCIITNSINHQFFQRNFFIIINKEEYIKVESFSLAFIQSKNTKIPETKLKYSLNYIEYHFISCGLLISKINKFSPPLLLKNNIHLPNIFQSFLHYSRFIIITIFSL